MKYALLCDDNFHHMDESERTVLAEFDNADEAIAAAKRIVDRELLHAHKPKMTADELYSPFTSFGSDPFIRSDDSSCKFSAWNYAKLRCQELCIPAGDAC
jgi:hypothetical protein